MIKKPYNKLTTHADFIITQYLTQILFTKTSTNQVSIQALSKFGSCELFGTDSVNKETCCGGELCGLKNCLKCQLTASSLLTFDISRNKKENSIGDAHTSQPEETIFNTMRYRSEKDQ